MPHRRSRSCQTAQRHIANAVATGKRGVDAGRAVGQHIVAITDDVADTDGLASLTAESRRTVGVKLPPALA